MSNYIALEYIGTSAYGHNNIEYATLTGCASLKTIGSFSFSANPIKSLDISRCTSLSIIGTKAFDGCELTEINLKTCSSLVEIGENAFRGMKPVHFNLPIPDIDGRTFKYWHNPYYRKKIVPNEAASYMYCKAFLEFNNPYFLTDEDVIVENGILKSCSYDFSITKVIIPEKLNNQFVEVIAEKAFMEKGISSITLPKSIKRIEEKAFSDNELHFLDLSNYASLEYIGSDAFKKNRISEINFNGCTSLKYIGSDAFSRNELSEINLNGCTSLKTIGQSCFSGNSITSLDLSECTSLSVIEDYAFITGELKELDLSSCTSLIKIGNLAFSALQTGYYKLPKPYIDGAYFLYWKDSESNAIESNLADTHMQCQAVFVDNPTYILTDKDVVVENGVLMSCSYDFSLARIVIPEILDNQYVEVIAKKVFKNKSLISITLPKSVVHIEKNAFSGNMLSEISFEGCSSLQTIGDYSFAKNPVEWLDVYGCNSLSSIGSHAFDGCELNGINLESCSLLVEIGADAFSGSKYKYYELPTPNIDGSTFKYWIDLRGEKISPDMAICSMYYKAVLENNPIYSLTDEDVVVENGKLISCSDNFIEKDIVIPEILDGQTITVIGKKSFESRYITSLILPKTITHIEDMAFYGNKLVTLDLSGHTALKEIGQNAFGGSMLTSINLSNCSSLKIISWHAFYSNELTKLNLNGCSGLTTIGENAFSDNHLTSLDLSSCTSLVLIKAEAFNGDKLKSFKLPKPKIEGKIFSYWVDSDGDRYKDDQSVSVLWKQYAVVFE